jgi:hypothetical protein
LIGGGAMPKTIRMTVSGDYISYPVVVDPSVSVTGSLAAARGYRTAPLLQNDDVPIAGGFNNTSGYLTSVELYDPVSIISFFNPPEGYFQNAR